MSDSPADVETIQKELVPGGITTGDSTENEKHRQSNAPIAESLLTEAMSQSNRQEGFAILEEPRSKDGERVGHTSEGQMSLDSNLTTLVGGVPVGAVLAQQEETPAAFPPKPTNGTRKIPGWKGWLRSASSTSSVTLLGRTSLPLQDKATLANSSSNSSNMLGNALASMKQSVNQAENIDWDLYEAISANENPSTMLEKVAIQVVPESLRGLLWQVAADSKNVDLEHVYSELKLAESSMAYKQIQKDLNRTSKVWLKAISRTVNADKAFAHAHKC